MREADPEPTATERTIVNGLPAAQMRSAIPQEAINRVREFDPNWRPSPSAYSTIEGASLDDLMVASTPSCVAITCMPDSDGQTEITIGAMRDVRLEASPLFDGRLQTPSGRVVVVIAPGKTILEVSVPRSDMHVCVWTNGFRDTDLERIGLAQR